MFGQGLENTSQGPARKDFRLTNNISRLTLRRMPPREYLRGSRLQEGGSRKVHRFPPAARPGTRQARRPQGHTPIPQREASRPGHRTKRRRFGCRTSCPLTLPVTAALPRATALVNRRLFPQSKASSPSLSGRGGTENPSPTNRLREGSTSLPSEAERDQPYECFRGPSRGFCRLGREAAHTCSLAPRTRPSRTRQVGGRGGREAARLSAVLTRQEPAARPPS